MISLITYRWIESEVIAKFKFEVSLNNNKTLA